MMARISQTLENVPNFIANLLYRDIKTLSVRFFR